MRVTVIGLGLQRSPDTYQEELSSGPIFARNEAEALAWLTGSNDNLIPLDQVFEDDDIATIRDRFLHEFRSAAQRTEVATYLVPGAANFGDVTVGWLADEFDVVIQAGQLECRKASGSCRIVDALALAMAEERRPFDTGLEALNAATTIVMTNFRGSEIQRLARARLDREAGLGKSELIGATLVRDAEVKPAETAAFDGLARIVSILRSPDGCPWDREQTVDSLLPQLDEELEELREAMVSGAPIDQADELGDVLLHIVMIAQVAREAGWFTMEDVVRSISAKMVRRHPHVFGDVEINSIEELYEMWDEIKRREKARS